MISVKIKIFLTTLKTLADPMPEFRSPVTMLRIQLGCFTAAAVISLGLSLIQTGCLSKTIIIVQVLFALCRAIRANTVQCLTYRGKSSKDSSSLCLSAEFEL